MAFQPLPCYALGTTLSLDEALVPIGLPTPGLDAWTRIAVLCWFKAMSLPS
jgi:hypothetical protein